MSLIKENSKIIDLNQFACEHELYDKFTQSEDYESILLDIKKLCPIVADLIENHGIGKNLNPNGSYPFDDDYVLTNFPNLEENEVFIELIFEEICDLAQAYSNFVIKTEAESSNQEECSLDQ